MAKVGFKYSMTNFRKEGDSRLCSMAMSLVARLSNSTTSFGAAGFSSGDSRL